MPREALPIDDVLPQLLQGLQSRGALVLKAEPGAGKTTRVPPAILDAGLANLAGRDEGEIIVLQPRRVAARAAAARVAEERGSELGEEIGYQVRFEKRVSRKTRILYCTEGVFLRRLQDDPLLERVAAVVFDEFHERSIDGDLALSMVRQVRRELRPELLLVVMSATLAAEPVAKYLDDCPSLECPGRVYPVEIEFLQFSSNRPIEEQVADAVCKMLRMSDGDILAFLPGVGEIQRTQNLLQKNADEDELTLMPLYGEMPLEEQRRVLLPAEKRKIVLATNVAETSLTIDGIKAVVDSGLARSNRLDVHLGLNRLQLGRISRASAEQRAGRAGRRSAGHCLRLWTEREHFGLRDFEEPEVSRVELSQCLLQLLLWGEKDPRSFPWFEAPPEATIEQAMQLLSNLDAINSSGITALGKQMAALPLQPRLARLLLEGQRLGCGRRTALAAALLSEREPFRREGKRAEAVHKSDSDLLDRISAIEDYAETGQRHSYVGEILSGPAKQILRASEQLNRLLGGAANSQSPERSSGSAKNSGTTSGAKVDEAILQALVTAFPDRVCKRREARGRRALMVGGRGVRLADESAVTDAELFLAVELADSGQSETLVRQASLVERAWLPQMHLSSSVEVAFEPERQRVVATKRSRFCDLILSDTITAIPAEIDAGEILAEGVISHLTIETLIDEDSAQYLLRIKCLREWMPELNLPELSNELWHELLPEWCSGCSSVDELKSRSLLPYIQARLTHKQISEIDSEAPERFNLPNGRKVKLVYELGKPPVLAARIQELFGMRETPRIAGERISLLLHLLAPNYRVQQITPDLASFWKNTYEDVRKELKGRYPKHPWPQDPLIPLPNRPKKER